MVSVMHSIGYDTWNNDLDFKFSFMSTKYNIALTRLKYIDTSEWLLIDSDMHSIDQAHMMMQMNKGLKWWYIQ